MARTTPPPADVLSIINRRRAHAAQIRPSREAAIKLGLPRGMWIAEHDMYGTCVVAPSPDPAHNNHYAALYFDKENRIVVVGDFQLDELAPVVVTELPAWVMVTNHDTYGLCVVSRTPNIVPADFPLASLYHNMHMALVFNGLSDMPMHTTISPEQIAMLRERTT